MKLRIKGNTIRIRMTKSEVAYFSENRFIEESTDFGSRKFTYGMKACDGLDQIKAEYINDGIIISIPVEMSKEWTETNRVGMSEEIPLSDNKKLYVLIEKDFKCLDETSEDQSDNYANPLSDKLK